MAARIRIVLAQVAVVLVVAAWAAGPVLALVALPFALAVVALVAGRLRHRPLSRWAADAAHYLDRRRTLPAGAGGAGLLALVRPGATTSSIDVDGADVGVVEDTDGLAAIVRVGDRSGLLGTAQPSLPPLSTLLPAPARDVPEVRVQLLVCAVSAPAPSTSPSATSYRQLTDGRVPARQRVLVAVRVRRAGGYRRGDLEQSLVLAIRRIGRQLAKSGLPALPLSAASALAALTEAAQHDPAHPARETWTGVHLGGLHHASFRVHRWPDQGSPTGRLLTLPTSATALSLTAQRPTTPAAATPAGTAHGPTTVAAATGPHGTAHGLTAVATSQDGRGPHYRPGAATTGPDEPLRPGEEPAVRAELVVRLAAPTAATLTQATAALHRLAASLNAAVTRLDGAQLEGLAATLPLGGGAPGDDALLAGLVTGRDGLAPGGGRPASVTAARLAAVAPAVAAEGVMLGTNRDGAPVLVRLFRPEPTRATLVGGLRCAQLLILRALATGARVAIQSTRPQAWEPFQRAVGVAEPLTIARPGRLKDPPAATAARPQLLVLDLGPAPTRGAAPAPQSAWRTTLHVRDDLTAADTDLLTRSDLTLLQPLTPQEATVAADALGLRDSRAWLTRISPEMLGIVVNRQAIRWTRLSTTPIELQLTGGPAR
jgi:type VII secretion protein EccE